MQKTSADYERLRGAADLVYENRLIIDGVGTFSADKLFSISTSHNMFQNSPEIGKAISGEVSISMLSPDNGIPKMARMRLYVRAKGTAARSSSVAVTDGDLSSPYATYSNGNITFSEQSGAVVSGTNLSFPVDSEEPITSEWLPQGVFFVDTRQTSANNNGLDVLTIHGFDAMLKGEQDYAGDAVGGDYDTAFVSSIAAQMGVSVDPRTWDIMGAGHIITFPLGYSCREILGYIAGIYIGCFVVTDKGALRLVSLLALPPETNLLTDEIGDVLVFGNDAILI